MMVLTLMPEAESYGIAVLVLNGISASSLAVLLHRWWAADRGIRYSHVYMFVMLIIVLWGGLILDSHSLIGAPHSWLLGIVLGGVSGLLATQADQAIRRFADRRYQEPSTFRAGRRGAHQESRRWGTINRNGTTYGPNLQALDDQVKHYGFTLWQLIAVATLEEMIYRGWLLEVCRLLPSGALSGTAVTATLLAFSLLHLPFGWSHVVGKTPLGVLALISVLISGSVMAGIVAHVCFNVQVWHEQRASRLGYAHAGEDKRSPLARS
jgi:hypothetical protein